MTFDVRESMMNWSTPTVAALMLFTGFVDWFPPYGNGIEVQNFAKFIGGTVAFGATGMTLSYIVHRLAGKA